MISPGAVSDPSCPHCRTASVTAQGAVPGCPRCEWNLDHFEPARRSPEFGWMWVDRLTHRVAYRLTARQFTALVSGPLERPSWSVARLVTSGVSLVVLVLMVALAVAGIWLVLDEFPRPMTVVGALLLALVVAVRPRIGRLDTAVRVLERATAPALFDLIERVCAATGAAVPDIVGVDAEVNAYTTTVGLRRHRVLCLGLPLWSVLGPQERVALLGHEMGHFVNGDVRRGAVTDTAVRALGEASALTAPSGVDRDGGLLVMVASAFAAVVQWVLSGLLFGVHLVLVWVSQRDSQRAEYLADELAARAAGSAAAIRLQEVALQTETIDMLVRRESRAGNGPDAWRAIVDQARAQAAPSLPVRRQLTQRDDVSLFASHPPAGLRAAMLQRRPAHPASVTLTEQQAERIDRELSQHGEWLRRDLAAG